MTSCLATALLLSYLIEQAVTTLFQTGKRRNFWKPAAESMSHFLDLQQAHMSLRDGRSTSGSGQRPVVTFIKDTVQHRPVTPVTPPPSVTSSSLVMVKAAAVSPGSNNSTNGADSGRGPSSEESQSVRVAVTPATNTAGGVDGIDGIPQDRHEPHLHHQQHHQHHGMMAEIACTRDEGPETDDGNVLTEIMSSRLVAMAAVDHQRRAIRRVDIADRLIPEVRKHWPDVVARCSSSQDDGNSVCDPTRFAMTSSSIAVPEAAQPSDKGDVNAPRSQPPRAHQRQLDLRPSRHSAILSTFGTISGSQPGGRRIVGPNWGFYPSATTMMMTKRGGAWCDLPCGRLPSDASFATFGRQPNRRRPAQLVPFAGDPFPSAGRITVDPYARFRYSHSTGTRAADEDDDDGEFGARPSNGMLGRHSWSITCLQDLQNGNGTLQASPVNAGRVPKDDGAVDSCVSVVDDDVARFAYRSRDPSLPSAGSRRPRQHVLLC